MDRMEVDYVETRHGDGGGGDRPVTIQEQDAYSPAGPSLTRTSSDYATSHVHTAQTGLLECFMTCQRERAISSISFDRAIDREF
jgi:hypothetical protein